MPSVSANGVNINVVGINTGTNQAIVTISSDFSDRCLQGFVWREAFPGDHVCVRPWVRDRAARDNYRTAENLSAAARRSPTGGPFGVDSCRAGFVWREASPTDHVCVPPASRTRAHDDNAAGATRKNPARNVFGTHDHRLIDAILAEATARGLPRAAAEFHLLYGIQRAEQERLARAGWPVRVLISYGAYWFPWYMRRLAERPANVLFVVKSLFAR